MPTWAAANTYLEAGDKLFDVDPQRALANYRYALENYLEIRKTADGDFLKSVDRKIEYCLEKIDKIQHPKRERLGDGDGDGTNLSVSVRYPEENFSRVAGMDEVKRKIEEEIIIPLMYPGLSKEYVDQSSRGIVLYGPPGCGKTYIAKSIPGEAYKRTGVKVGFIDVKISDILSSWVGESEKNMRRVFELAADHEPCVLFIDELDGLGMSRSSSDSDYSRRLVNEILQDFSIIENKRVLVIAGTNYPTNIDPALLRPERFDDSIFVGPPDYGARLKLFKLYTKGKNVDSNINYEELARLTQDYSAVDIRKICNEAGKIARRDAVRGNKRPINYSDFLSAIEKTSSSLYVWCDDMKNLIKKKKLSPVFSDLERIILEIDERRSAPSTL